MTPHKTRFHLLGTTLAAGVLSLTAIHGQRRYPAPRRCDHRWLSLCVGFDCVNGESFGFDTVRLKENNLRLHFDDTRPRRRSPETTGGSPPTTRRMAGQVIWRSRMPPPGGSRSASRPGRRPTRFMSMPRAMSASAPTTPVVDLHVIDGNTPTVRLEQDGSSGFTPQTWDLAGNETNFFIRDATNGSTLPFRITPVHRQAR